MEKIIEAGCSIANWPEFNGKWAAVVRRKNEVYGKQIGPLFDSATEAINYAELLKVGTNDTPT